MSSRVVTRIGPDTVSNDDILRLLELWRDRHRGSQLPHVDDFDVHDLWCCNNLMLVRCEPRDAYRYLHYGNAIARSSGFDMTGKCTADFASRTGEFFTRVYTRCKQAAIPLYTTHRAAHSRVVTEWERLLLPLVDDHGRVAQILVYNAPLGYQHELLRQMLSAISDVVLSLESVSNGSESGSASLFVTTINSAGEAFFDVSAIDAIGLPLEQALPGLEPMGLHAAIHACLRDQRSVEQLWTDVRTSSPRQYQLRCSPFESGVVMTLTDVSALMAKTRRLEQTNADLRRIANTDALTQASSRRHFLAHCKSEIVRAERYGLTLSLIYLDIDHFKRINDRYGHAAGDQILVEVAALATALIRDCDVLGRLGGEEFAILLPHSGARAALDLATRIRSSIASTAFRWRQARIDITCSFGVAQHEAGSGMDELLRRADEALYAAKRSGRNRVLEAG